MTDEERREVAARLRWIDAKDDPGNTALMLDKIRRAIGVHMNAPSVFPPYEWLVTYAHVTLNRLADLIDPTDETCEAEMTDVLKVHETVREYECSKCGMSWEIVWAYDYGYCPYCGRMIENADE